MNKLSNTPALAEKLVKIYYTDKTPERVLGFYDRACMSFIGIRGDIVIGSYDSFRKILIDDCEKRMPDCRAEHIHFEIKQLGSRECVVFGFFNLSMNENGQQAFQYKILVTQIFRQYSDGCRIIFVHASVQEKDTSGMIDRCREILLRSRMDALTGLYNRTYMEQSVDEFLLGQKAGKGCSACLLIDIDHFKQINDCYGHLRGDDTLKAFAGMLKDNYKADAVISRFGGDEFMVWMKNACCEKTIICNTEKLMACMSEYRQREGLPEAISLSIGIVMICGKRPFAEVYKAADIALYQAKTAGRNRWFFYREGMDYPV